MTWLKSCPRCNGDLCENRDLYGSYISCIQCGHYLTEMEEVLLRYRPQHEAERDTDKIPAAA